MKKDLNKTKEQLFSELNDLRKKSKEREKILKAANQQLLATEQQLRAANQQLKANNQQLAANEQQLRAANQQLIASEEEIKNYAHKLGERVKELDCFYGISKIVEIPDISLEEIFRRTVKLIPESWQYPEITVCRIILDDKEYKTQDFKKTKWSQRSDIIIDGKHIGNIEVCYLKKMPDSDEGPFLKEERLLLDALAERLEKITERKKAEEKLRAANQQLAASERQLRAANQQFAASEQQLRAANQQLAASEQQLRAANQQLEANNQQLVASEQQLRAANQQFYANEQQLRAANQQLIASEFELIKEKKFSESIVETANAIIVGLDKDHKIRIFNQGAENITGYTKAEVIGKDWFKIFFPKEILNEMNKVWKNSWGVKSHSYVNPILSKAGKEIIVSWQTTGMYESEDTSKHLLISIGEDRN